MFRLDFTSLSITKIRLESSESDERFLQANPTSIIIILLLAYVLDTFFTSSQKGRLFSDLGGFGTMFF
jgi:hypothetical protein